MGGELDFPNGGWSGRRMDGRKDGINHTQTRARLSVRKADWVSIRLELHGRDASGRVLHRVERLWRFMRAEESRPGHELTVLR